MVVVLHVLIIHHFQAVVEVEPQIFDAVLMPLQIAWSLPVVEVDLTVIEQLQVGREGILQEPLAGKALVHTLPEEGVRQVQAELLAVHAHKLAPSVLVATAAAVTVAEVGVVIMGEALVIVQEQEEVPATLPAVLLLLAWPLQQALDLLYSVGLLPIQQLNRPSIPQSSRLPNQRSSPP